MKLLEEISTIKKEIKILSTRLDKISQSNEEIKKLITKNNPDLNKKKSRRKISYIDWLDNERRMKNLISPY